MHVGELTETKSAATRRVNIAIHLYGWTRRHDLENFSNLLVQFEVGYGTPILGSCKERERGLKYKECITERKKKRKEKELKKRSLIYSRIIFHPLFVGSPFSCSSEFWREKEGGDIVEWPLASRRIFSRQEFVREKRLQTLDSEAGVKTKIFTAEVSLKELQGT